MKHWHFADWVFDYIEELLLNISWGMIMVTVFHIYIHIHVYNMYKIYICMHV